MFSIFHEANITNQQSATSCNMKQSQYAVYN